MYQEQIKQLVEQENPANPLAYVRDIVRPLSQKKLNQYIKSCQDCATCSRRTKSAAYGNPYAPVLIVQDTIRKEQIESDAILPYDPTSSFLVDTFLTQMLSKYAIDSNKLLWMHAIQCPLISVIDTETIYRTAPTIEEKQKCRIFLDFAIQAFAPMFILLLGNISLSMFIRDIGLSDIHGKLLHVLGVPAIATYGPDYLQYLRAATGEDSAKLFEEIFWQDIDTAVSFMKKENIPVFTERKSQTHDNK